MTLERILSTLLTSYLASDDSIDAGVPELPIRIGPVPDSDIGTSQITITASSPDSTSVADYTLSITLHGQITEAQTMGTLDGYHDAIAARLADRDALDDWIQDQDNDLLTGYQILKVLLPALETPIHDPDSREVELTTTLRMIIQRA